MILSFLTEPPILSKIGGSFIETYQAISTMEINYLTVIIF